MSDVNWLYLVVKWCKSRHLDLFKIVDVQVVTKCISMMFRLWMQQHKPETRDGYEDLPIYMETDEERKRLLGL